MVQFSSKPEAKSATSQPEAASNTNAEEAKQDPQNQPESSKKWQRNYDNLAENDRQSMLVDEIFALYLFRLSQKVNETFYKTVLMYTILFRECLNEIGW